MIIISEVINSIYVAIPWIMINQESEETDRFEISKKLSTLSNLMDDLLIEI